MLLAVENLCVDFRTRQGVVRAVDHVSFTLDAGQIVGVVGESGSGKTLCQLAIMGLIGNPNAVVSGSIRLDGRELLGQPARDWRALRGGRIAMIFQDPLGALTPVYTIGDQIIEQIRAHQDVSRRAAQARAIELLGEMGMPRPRAQAGLYPHQLSGGMRQRAMIAMALCCNPALLIADEPTTALDVTVQAQILDLLRRLRRDFGSSIIIITHDLGVVAEIADQVMVMYAGRLIEAGPCAALLETPRHPYTAALLHSIPPLAGPRLARLPAIAGSPPLPQALPPGCAFGPRCAQRHAPCQTRPALLRQDGREIACWLEASS